MWAPAPYEQIVAPIRQKRDKIKQNSQLSKVSKDEDTFIKET